MVSDEDLLSILDANQDQLTKLPNVVGLGITEPVKGTKAIAVYVSKLPAHSSTGDDVIPAFVGSIVSGSAVDVPTQVIEVGEIKPQ